MPAMDPLFPRQVYTTIKLMLISKVHRPLICKRSKNQKLTTLTYFYSYNDKTINKTKIIKVYILFVC